MFNPSFTYVDTSAEAADIINKPHEDYPLRVSVTKWCIDYIIPQLAVYPVSEAGIRAIHAIIMPELPDYGQYRRCEVTVGNDKPPDFIHVPRLMHEITPVVCEVESDIQQWYIRFEMIHPFSDGNGRVGGIILAAISKYKFGRYMVAK